MRGDVILICKLKTFPSLVGERQFKAARIGVRQLKAARMGERQFKAARMGGRQFKAAPAALVGAKGSSGHGWAPIQGSSGSIGGC